jgi:hypothetical protein
MTEVQLPDPLECQQCGHKWTPRKKNVKRCARCKSPYWDEPPKNRRKAYARPRGGHYHLRKDCQMLTGGQFEKLGYKEITITEARSRKLIPCTCAQDGKRRTR